MSERQLLQIVEIDVDQCTRAYGTAPCAAILGTTGVRKCYNSRFTCQDPVNFNRGTLTLRFAPNQMGLPKGQLVFPALRGVSTSAQEINLSGIDPYRGPLGARAEVRVQIDDFTYGDYVTDPYRDERVEGTAQTDEPGYNPQDRGTFWSKFRSRNPYIVGRFMRVREGYVGQAFNDMRTRHYVITQIDGPSAGGGVTITARDVLDLADNDKATAPAPSLGKLAAAMSDVATSFTLEGDPTLYPQNGRVAIGGEIIEYRRASTSDATFEVVRRQVDGTVVQAHNIGDSVQACVRWENAKLYEVVRDLLRDYAGVPNGFIPFSEWETEGIRWQAAYTVTRTLAKPTGVLDLIGQLALFGVSIWWDEINQKIRYVANRPVDLPQGETYIDIVDTPGPQFSEAAHMIDGSVSVGYREDQRLSRVRIWHGQINTLGSDTDPANYRKLSEASDLSQEAPEKYGQMRMREFFTPWLGNNGNFIIADSVARRMRDRFRNTPVHVAFDVDAKDADVVELGARVRVFTRHAQDETGRPLGLPMQVRAVTEVVSGHRLQAEAETFTFDGRYGFITDNARPDYSGSTDEERALGVYFVGNALEFPDGTPPYIMF